MKLLTFFILFIALSACLYAQQMKFPAELGYDNQVDIKKITKGKQKIIQHLHTVLKGGIWDEILPNMVYVHSAGIPIWCYEHSDEDNPPNKVSWSIMFSGFYILNTEVTNKMYRYFLHDSTDIKYLPSYDEDSTIASVDLKDFFLGDVNGKKHSSYQDLDNYPVVGISWTAANAFCKWLEAKRTEALKATKDSTLLFISDFSLPFSVQYSTAAIMNEMNDSFSLREFKATFHEKLFSSLNVLGINYGEIASVNGTVLRDCERDGFYYTNPVKEFSPGRLGLYGMQGNAAEWALNEMDPFRFDTTFYNARTTRALADSAIKAYRSKNPLGPYGNYHIVQGGSWFDNPFYLQPCVIQKYYEKKRSARIGFRVICQDNNDQWLLECRSKAMQLKSTN
jgi:sulfatase modifying factor 1